MNNYDKNDIDIILEKYTEDQRALKHRAEQYINNDFDFIGEAAERWVYEYSGFSLKEAIDDTIDYNINKKISTGLNMTKLVAAILNKSIHIIEHNLKQPIFIPYIDTVYQVFPDKHSQDPIVKCVDGYPELKIKVIELDDGEVFHLDYKLENALKLISIDDEKLGVCYITHPYYKPDTIDNMMKAKDIMNKKYDI